MRLALTTPAASNATLLNGVLGGFVGGTLYGLFMTTQDTMPQIAALVGSESTTTAWLLHLAISILAGLSLAIFFNDRVGNIIDGLIWGVIVALIWWVIGAQLIMPAILRTDFFPLERAAYLNLVGHLLFGVILGAIFAFQQEGAAD